MEKVDTDILRAAAPKWSLGGDKRLLDTLQNMHQKIVTKCTETNTKLDVLINKLDTASIDLQNVNNKFMGLSNTQFIERRVYDDDVDIAPPVEPLKFQEPPKVIDPNEEMLKLKKAIQIFESMHEVVQILDSDSSDDEDEGSLVLKPKDVYSHRPLPYIIGSELWRTKWHAGLVFEESDTDSAGSKHEPREEYSDSESEVTDIQTDKHTAKDEWVSSSTSVEASVTNTSTKPTKPAEIAAELARRLGGDMIPPPPPMEAMPEPTTKKVYRPERPEAATIFSNEPPPLDQVDSDSEDDIFAELHRNRYTQNDRARPVNNVVEELFGNVESIKPPSNNVKSVLFDDDSESELFIEKPKTEEKSPETAENSDFKKPVGGISLFGSNKNSNSIGAALLKRQQQKSSDEESDSSKSPEVPRNKISSFEGSSEATENIKYKMPVNKNTVDNQKIVKPVQNNKDIIENIFAKPKAKKNMKPEQEIKEKIPEKKIDLFSDDLFDDIDDIFTSKITKKPDSKQKDKLFDSDDDIFSDNIVSKPSLNQVKKRLAFSDSDDDLFKEEIVPKKIENKSKKDELLEVKHDTKVNDQEPSPIIEKEVNETKSISDDVADHGLFSDLPKSTVEKQGISKENLQNYESDSHLFNAKPKHTIDSKETTEKIATLHTITNETVTNNEKSIMTSSNNVDKFKSILDDESDDDLFKSNSGSNAKGLVKSTIFDDESEEELFGKTNLNNQTVESNQDLNINETNKNRTKIVGGPEKEIMSATKSNAASNQHMPPGAINIIKTKNLFDDDSDEELFSGKSQASTVQKDSKPYSFEKVKEPTVVSYEKSYIEPKNINLLKPSTVIKANTMSNQKVTESKEIFSPTQNTKFHSPLVFNDEWNESEKSEKSLGTIENMPDIKGQREASSDAAEKISETLSNNAYNDQQIKLQDEEIFGKTPQPSLPDSSQINIDNQTNQYNKLNIKEDILKESNNITIVEGDKSSISDPEPKEIVSSIPEIVKESSPFSDIFNDVPPEFEKPKEPKRSKNVNALFDDDSDDENLFFKKNSDVSDEVLSPSYINDRFSIFHDEPPAIEVDFTSKTPKIPRNNTSNEEEISNIIESNVLNTEVTTTEPTSNFDETKITNPDLDLKTNPNSDGFDQSLASSIKSTNTLISDKINKLQIDSKKPNEDESKVKNIGKLKPVNFSINVNTLLPGATHKKTKLLEEIDGAASSKIESNESKEKPVQFKEEESAILDNKLSKERAKIQVKRRPSTRRARKEAARKSGIDFGTGIDSTDNSSLINEPKKEYKTENTHELDNEANELKNNNVANKGTENIKSTTKVVYILNDEDIFSDDNKNLETDLKSQAAPKSQNSEDTEKKSIFDLSDSESELFGANEIKVTSKTKLFDSNSDDDFFASKKKTIIKENKDKPLFSDESDDELFSTSKKNNEMQVSQTSRSKPSEPVFEDPLSMLNQDDS